MSDTKSAPFVFGIYPGGNTGAPGITNVSDDPVAIQKALDCLSAHQSPFVVRGYLPYRGGLYPYGTDALETPMNVEQYLRAGRKLDLVLTFRQPDLAGWLSFIRQTIRRYGSQLSFLQITEEANVTTVAVVDGSTPQVRQALVQGVIAAKEEILRCGLDIQVGFNAAINFNPADDFWTSIAALGGKPFLEALDYVGLDFFPDVFRRLAPDGQPGDLRASVALVLAHFRQVSLAAAGIAPSVPIHIAETGWPTGPERSYERQAEVLERVISVIYEHREQFNITHYEHFSLRDANSANPDLFAQFGLLRDDYTPKPAFERYCQLLARLESDAATQ